MEKLRRFFKSSPDATRQVRERMLETTDSLEIVIIFLKESTNNLLHDYPHESNRIDTLSDIAIQAGENMADSQFGRAMKTAGLSDKQILDVFIAKEEAAKIAKTTINKPTT